MTSKELRNGLPQVAVRDMGIPKRVERYRDSYLLSGHLRAYELAMQVPSPRPQEPIDDSSFRASVTFES